MTFELYFRCIQPCPYDIYAIFSLNFGWGTLPSMEPILWKDRTIYLFDSTEISLCCHLDETENALGMCTSSSNCLWILTIALIPCWKIYIGGIWMIFLLTLTCDVFIIIISFLNYLFWSSRLMPSNKRREHKILACYHGKPRSRGKPSHKLFLQ